VKGWSSAYAIDGDAINQVSSLRLNPGTDIASEEAQASGRYCRKPEPSNLVADFQEHALRSQRQWVGGKRKVAAIEKEGRRVSRHVKNHRPLVAPNHNRFTRAHVLDANGFFPVMSVIHDMCRRRETTDCIVLAVRNQEPGTGSARRGDTHHVRLYDFDGL